MTVGSPTIRWLWRIRHRFRGCGLIAYRRTAYESTTHLFSRVRHRDELEIDPSLQAREHAGCRTRAAPGACSARLRRSRSASNSIAASSPPPMTQMPAPVSRLIRPTNSAGLVETTSTAPSDSGFQRSREDDVPDARDSRLRRLLVRLAPHQRPCRSFSSRSRISRRSPSSIGASRRRGRAGRCSRRGCCRHRK